MTTAPTPHAQATPEHPELPATFLRNPQRLALVAALLALVALSLAAIHPLTFGSLPRTDDGLQHLYRLVALDTAIRHGDVWPRYVPTLLYGYGEPIFNYYSPMSLYLFEAFHLAGLRFQDAMLVGLILYLLVGAVGAYKLGESWGGPILGIGTAAATVYAPYTLLNLLERGAIGELAGLMLLPWVLWAFHQVAAQRRRRDLVLAVALLCLFLLMHNITALIGVALLVVYCLFLWWTGEHPPRIFVHLALAGFLGIGLAAFFWLPALAETSYVQLNKARIGVNNPPDTRDFYSQFQSLDETFAPPTPADLTWFNPPVQRTLSWPQIVLALLGMGLLLSSRAADREEGLLKRLLLVAITLVAAMIFMTTRPSAGVWASVPLLRYFQFPWRMLGPASLLLALMAGAGIAVVARMLTHRVTRVVWIALCLIVISVYSMPWLYRLYIPDPAASSVIDAQDYERKTGQLGGTARGEYVPVWTTKLPGADRLAGLYAKGDVIARLQPNSALSVRDQVWEPTSARLAFSASEDTVLTFDWIFFPGWWARLDGQEEAITPSQPNGLVALAVPPGDHQLELGFGPTLLRLVAMIASGVFAALTATAVSIFPRRLWPPPPRTEITPRLSELLPAALTAVSVGLALLALKAIVVDNVESPIKHAQFAAGVENGLQTPVWGVFNHQVTLLGYDLASPSVESGKSGQITLYWQPTDQVIPEDYSSTLTVRDITGAIVQQSGSFYPGGWATSNWVPGFWVQEVLPLDIPPATPPGVYSMEVSLYDPKAKVSLEALDAQANPRGTRLKIGEIRVTRPAAPARLDDLSAEERQGLVKLEGHLSDAVTLAAAHSLPASGQVGDPLAVIIYWRAEKAPGQPLTFRLVWADPSGTVMASSPLALPAGGYSADEWQPGDVWRGANAFSIPGKLNAGRYTVGIQLADAQGKLIGEPAALGQMEVTTPPRSFIRPKPNVATDTAWQNGIRLVGYDLFNLIVRRGDSIRLNLYWTTGAEIDTSLTAFVHIIDATGHIIAQVDSIPLGGSRPTTGWAPGEQLTDPIQVAIKPGTPGGEYFIRVGWYDAASGKRVEVTSGGIPDFWLLPQTIRVTAP